jgi:hypothetical protein
MSSTASPVIDLDCSPRRMQRRVSVAVLVMLMVGCTLMAAGPFALGPTLLLACLCLVVIAANLWRLGWMGSRCAVRRATWTSSGLWYILDAEGRVHEAILQPQSRILPLALWLHWRSGSLRFQAFLFAADVPGDALRHLRTRIRFESAPPAHAFEPLSS